MISDPLFSKCDDKVLMVNAKGPDIQNIKRLYRWFKLIDRNISIHYFVTFNSGVIDDKPQHSNCNKIQWSVFPPL